MGAAPKLTEQQLADLPALARPDLQLKGAEVDDPRTQQVEDIRAELFERLMKCAENERTALSIQDAKDYFNMGLNDAAFHALSTEDKLKRLQENKQMYVPNFIRQAEQLGNQYLEEISRAEADGAITGDRAKRWRKRLKEGTWLDTQRFFDEFKDRMKNWRELQKDKKTIAALQTKLKVDEKRIPELKGLDAILNEKDYSTCRAAVDLALAALRAYEKGEYPGAKEKDPQRTQFIKAQDMLRQAVIDGYLSGNKMKNWLRRIFDSSADTKKIEAFLSGNGSDSLPSLMQNWRKVKERFDGIEQKRAEKGTPRNFHFVNEVIFLDLHYEKRVTYVEQAEQSFESLEKDSVDLLQIRHALAARDWYDAEELIAEAKQKELTPEEQQTLASLEQHLRQYRTFAIEQEIPQEKPSDQELNDKLTYCINLFPPSLQEQAEVATSDPEVARTWGGMLYNRVWSHEHGYLTAAVELDLYEQSKEPTRQRIQEGHSEYYEANDVTGENNDVAAIRTEEKLNAAQALFTSSESTASVMTAIENNKNNRHLWYWTSIIPVGVDYATHRQAVENVLPEFKRLVREMNRRGLRHTRAGPVQRKGGQTVREASEKKEPPPPPQVWKKAA